MLKSGCQLDLVWIQLIDLLLGRSVKNFPGRFSPQACSNERRSKEKFHFFPACLCFSCTSYIVTISASATIILENTRIQMLQTCSMDRRPAALLESSKLLIHTGTVVASNLWTEQKLFLLLCRVKSHCWTGSLSHLRKLNTCLLLCITQSVLSL